MGIAFLQINRQSASCISCDDNYLHITVKTASFHDLRYRFAMISRWLESGENVKILDHGKIWKISLTAEQKAKMRAVAARKKLLVKPQPALR